jgi:cytochrome c oxidase subunit 2
MKISGMGMRNWAAASGLSLLGALAATHAWAAADRHAPVVGRPVPGGIALQPGASELRYKAIEFHDGILLPIITVIALFVLALLLWVMIRYNKRANPTPARWSHNTFIEIVWTVIPVLILMVIAIFSFPLLFAYHTLPGRPYLTVKATGYQWYWGYAYPDQKISEFTSNMAAEDKTTAELYRLASDNPIVVPVNKLIRVDVTGADVIHSFSVPAFGIKIDAVPGKLNETFFQADKTGDFYGQCSQLCGVNHSFMPIHVRVVSDAEFSQWVAAHHGTLFAHAAAAVGTAAANAPAGAAPAAAPATNAAAPATNPPAAATPAAPAAKQPAAAAPAAPATK